jgi:hypothetical protein
MLKKIILNKYFLIFFLIHILLVNVNFAEWGDTYRILRASEHIRALSYPQDEKRQPLYSLVLAVRPPGIDQVVWGRYVMAGISIFSFILFSLLLDQIRFDNKKKKTALLLYTFNPVILYWSLRVYADMFFMSQVLLIFYLIERWEDMYTNKRLLVIGFMLGLSILTRFEGYLLTAAVILGHFIFAINDNRNNTAFSKIKGVIMISVATLFTAVPWFVVRNPFISTYFEEPQRRVYDTNTFLIFLASLLFLFGFTSAFLFFYRSRYHIKDFFNYHKSIKIFILLELLLCMLWPAAIPRLFLPIIPFLIIALSFSSVDFFLIENHSKKVYINVSIMLSLFSFYLLVQYFYKLQFLVLIKSAFFIILLIQLVNMISVIIKNQRIFMFSMFVSAAMWSLATIYLHKDIYRAVVEANIYIVENLDGKVAYNDVSSISDWYLNEKSKEDLVEGFYLDMDTREGRTYEVLKEQEVDYLLITNEHNTDMEFSSEGISYLVELTEFRYTIRGQEFFSKVLEFKN